MQNSQYYNSFIEKAFSQGLAPFVQSLNNQEIHHCQRILDIGCGPGHWLFAAAKLVPDAELTGVDINEQFIHSAQEYSLRHNFTNCKFICESINNLPAIMKGESFDLILCNSTIQYLDVIKAFAIFSSLLKINGILLMFWNHGSGYYLRRFFREIMGLKFKQAYYPFYVLTVNTLCELFFHEYSTDHYVTSHQLKKIGDSYNIEVSSIPNDPKFGYKEKFLFITEVFSCRGIKKA